MSHYNTPSDPSASSSPPTIPPRTFHISGIVVDVYGLDQLPQPCESVSCLWLLHGRLQSKEVTAAIASTCISHWNQQRPDHFKSLGLLGVSFDQRNHGTRQINAQANQAWKKNENHALDMYSIFSGTALDISFLIDHLASYVFPGSSAPAIGQHLVLGFSLGGHATWQVFFNDPRVTAAIAIIACPDYMHLMFDRARLSERDSYTTSNGSGFFGSRDFPHTLISSVLKRDPKALLFGTGEINFNPSQSEQRRLREILDTKVKGKRVLVCSGGDDKLVPYRCSEPFLRFLKQAADGWYSDGDFSIEDIVYPGVGHDYSEGMIQDTLRFVNDTLAGPLNTGEKKESRM